MVKSGHGAQAISVKKQKLADEAVRLHALEEKDTADKLLSELLCLVVGNTDLLKKLLAQAHFLLEGRLTSDEAFPKTYIYINKVPKDFVMGELVPGIFPNLNADGLALASKADRRIDQKLHYMAGGMTGRQKIMNHDKKLYIDVLRARHETLQKPLAWIKFSGADGSINWQSEGFYELQPVMNLAVADRDQHIYKSVRCKALPPAVCEKALPTLYHINGNWSIRQNWLLTADLESPSSQKPRVSFSLAELFSDHVGMAELLEELPVYGKRAERKAQQALAQKAPGGVKRKGLLAQSSDDRAAKVKAALNRLKRMEVPS